MWSRDFCGELLEMAKVSQKPLLTPAASYFGEGTLIDGGS